MKTDGKQTYIRNFSTSQNVLYIGSEKKDLGTLGEMGILKKFTGILTHDHETAMYRFGTGHGECNVHLERYLRKNTEETGNSWSYKLGCFLRGMNHARKERQKQDQAEFYNGPRNSDHGWQKDREHGRISKSTERGKEPWHEQRTARSSKQN